MTGERGERCTRRAMLGAGTALLAASAGCTFGAVDSDGGTDDGSDGDAGGAFAYPLRSPIESTQFNPWLTGYPRSVSPLFFAYRSTYRMGEGRRFDHLIEEVEIDGTTAIARYSDAYTWWNGEPVTARDDFVRLRLQKQLRERESASGRDRAAGERDRATRGRDRATPVSRYDPAVELVDDYAIRYEFDDALRPELLRSVVADGMLTTAEWLFGDRVERVESATTAAERDAELDAFREYRVPFEEAMEEGFGCGPFRPTALLEPRVECELFPDHPAADAIGVDELDLVVARGTRDRQLLVNDELDAGQRTLSDLGSAVPSSIEQLDRYRLADGMKLLLNWRGPLADRRIRWAVAAALPLENLAANSGLGDPAKRQTGLGTPVEAQWLSDDAADRLYDHPVQAAPDRAAEHIAAAGYERSGGRWRDADGRPIEFVLRTPTRSAWQVAARTVEESLGAVGIEVRTRSNEFGTFYSQVRDGVYDLALWWAAGRPFETYDVTSPELSHLGYGVADPSADRSPHGKPVAPAVPSRVTGPDPESAKRVNLVDRWRALRTAASDASAREAVETFARWWNFDLPDVRLVDGVAAVWGDTGHYDWPDAGDPALRTFGTAVRPELHALVTGAVSENS